MVVDWRPQVTEQTIIETMDIPGGDDYRWMPELNMIILSPRLDALGRRRTVDRIYEEWRCNGCVEATA